nr:MAG TPA_asm: hypothetical protein [Caudoviricetes sp.]
MLFQDTHRVPQLGITEYSPVFYSWVVAAIQLQ